MSKMVRLLKQLKLLTVKHEDEEIKSFRGFFVNLLKIAKIIVKSDAKINKLFFLF